MSALTSLTVGTRTFFPGAIWRCTLGGWQCSRRPWLAGPGLCPVPGLLSMGALQDHSPEALPFGSWSSWQGSPHTHGPHGRDCIHFCLPTILGGLPDPWGRLCATKPQRGKQLAGHGKQAVESGQIAEAEARPWPSTTPHPHARPTGDSASWGDSGALLGKELMVQRAGLPIGAALERAPPRTWCATRDLSSQGRDSLLWFPSKR